MLGNRLNRRFAEPLRDFAAAAITFVLWAFWMGWLPPPETGWIAGAAHAGLFEEDAYATVLSAGVWNSVHNALTVLSLGLAFSTTITLNLWLFRHIRHIHAHDRRYGR